MVMTHVVLPADGVQCNRVNVLVEDEGKGDGEVEDDETLGTDVEGENLDGVGHNQGGEGQAGVEGKFSASPNTEWTYS